MSSYIYTASGEYIPSSIESFNNTDSHPCDPFSMDSKMVSNECFAELWKSVRCTTNPDISEFKYFKRSDIENTIDTYASVKTDLNFQKCYGDPSEYPAVRLYTTNKKLQSNEILNFPVGKHVLDDHLIHQVKIYPNYKLSIFKNNDFTGEYRSFIYDIDDLFNYKMNDGTPWNDSVIAIQVDHIPDIKIPNYCTNYINSDIVSLSNGPNKCIEQLWTNNGCITDYPGPTNIKLSDLNAYIDDINDTTNNSTIMKCYGDDPIMWPNDYIDKNNITITNRHNYTVASVNNNPKTKCQTPREPIIYKDSTLDKCHNLCRENDKCTGFHLTQVTNKGYNCNISIDENINSVADSNSFGCQIKNRSVLNQDIPLYTNKQLISANNKYSATYTDKGNLCIQDLSINNVPSEMQHRNKYKWCINPSLNNNVIPSKMIVNKKGEIVMFDINNLPIYTSNINVPKNLNPYGLFLENDGNLYIIDKDNNKLASSQNNFNI